MNIAIIEDDKEIVKKLSILLKNINSKIHIITTLSDVRELKKFLKTKFSCQLIFSNTHLGTVKTFDVINDAHSFIPIIYYSQSENYKVQAFENGGIAHIALPFIEDTIKNALKKYMQLQDFFAQKEPARAKSREVGINTFLINVKNKIIPIKKQDVAYFTINNRRTYLTTFNNEEYIVNHTLEELELMCSPLFFRANRQFLINKNNVKEIIHYSLRKLFVGTIINTPTEVIINKNKISEFLNWMKK